MSKRGLSLDEKRKRMLDIFYEKKDVFQLKDLEKIGPHEKGIVMQSVKDVVQSLVDDGVVDSEKIGTSSYFWAFPSKATQVRKTKLNTLGQKEVQLKTDIQSLTEQIKRSKATRNETPQRTELMEQVAQLQSQNEELIKIVEEYADLDPDVIEREKQEIMEYQCNCNRWTENLLGMKKFLSSKFQVPESLILEQFDLREEDFEYIEEPEKGEIEYSEDEDVEMEDGEVR